MPGYYQLKRFYLQKFFCFIWVGSFLFTAIYIYKHQTEHKRVIPTRTNSQLLSLWYNSCRSTHVSYLKQLTQSFRRRRPGNSVQITHRAAVPGLRAWAAAVAASKPRASRAASSPFLLCRLKQLESLSLRRCPGGELLTRQTTTNYSTRLYACAGTCTCEWVYSAVIARWYMYIK